MSMNILSLEKIILDLFRRKMILTLSENLEINVRIASKSFEIIHKSVNKIIVVERLIILSTKFIVSMFVKMIKVLFDRDYLFQSISRELNLESFDEIMTHIATLSQRSRSSVRGADYEPSTCVENPRY